MNKTLWYLVALILIAGPSADAGVIVQAKGRAQLHFSKQTTLALSETIRVDLVVEGTSALQVDMPKEMPADSKWILVERWPALQATVGPNRKSWSVNCWFAPLEPGKKVPFRFPDVKVKDGPIEETISFTPVYCEVTTQIQKVDRAELKDITAIEPLPPMVPTDYAWIWWSILGGASCIFAISALLLRSLLRKTPTRSASQVALQELDRLLAMKLLQNGKSERFVTLLTMLVRRYLERRYSLPARRQTTPEFLANLAQTALMTMEEKQFLTSFLRRCEAVKFANADISTEECGIVAESVRQFLVGRSVTNNSPPTLE